MSFRFTKQIPLMLNAGKSLEEVVEFCNLSSKRKWTVKSLQWFIRYHNVMGTNIETVELEDGKYFGFDEDRTFGIEIEMLAQKYDSIYNMYEHYTKLAEDITRLSGLVCEYQDYNHRASNVWKLVTDASLRLITNFQQEKCFTIELVSPILKGYDGLEQIEKISKALKELKCEINVSCGLHVHHNITKFDDSNIVRETLKNIQKIYAKNQSEINKFLPKDRWKSSFAKKMGPSKLYGNGWRSNNALQNRYNAVNSSAYLRHGTIEFRQHSGTIESIKIINWIMITQSMVNFCEKKMNDNNNSYIIRREDKYKLKELILDKKVMKYISDRKDYFKKKYTQPIVMGVAV